MGTFLRVLCWMGGVCLLLFLAFTAQARQKSIQVPTQSLVHALTSQVGQKFLGIKENLVEEAVIRSNQEHSEIKKKMIREIDQRIRSWEQRDPSSIKLTVDGSYSFAAFEAGIDDSGLDTLKSHVELESADIDFENEFKEVNSVE